MADMERRNASPSRRRACHQPVIAEPPLRIGVPAAHDAPATPPTAWADARAGAATKDERLLSRTDSA